MSKKDYREMIKAYLKSYRVVKAKLKSDKKLLELYNKNDFLRSKTYHDDIVQSSNKINQEDLIIKNIEKKQELVFIIQENELRIQAIETVLEALDERQRLIIEEKFINKKTITYIADKIYASERSVNNYFNEVYELLGIAMFGEKYLIA